MDIALAGKIAIIESIEQDYEGKIQVAIVLDDDPGKDLGMLRQPGHRFFFSRRGDRTGMTEPRILIACIGNIFLGDDGFGVEVARRLAGRPLPPGVILKDFGIRGLDLTYALLDPYDLVILVDACPRGGEPAAVYVIEPDPSDSAIPDGQPCRARGARHESDERAAHGQSQWAERPGRILIVGCEPADLGRRRRQAGFERAGRRPQSTKRYA